MELENAGPPVGDLAQHVPLWTICKVRCSLFSPLVNTGSGCEREEETAGEKMAE